MEKGQGERLVPLLEALLADAAISWRDVTAIAVGTGPGNFTGVRIAVATARGLALGLNIPAVGVTRLEALAYGLPRPLRVVEDARRGMVYTQTFHDDGSAEPAALIEVDAVSPQTTPQAIAQTGGAAGPNALPPACALAEAIARIGAPRARLPQPRPAPFYLRAADAAPPSDPPPVILDA